MLSAGDRKTTVIIKMAGLVMSKLSSSTFLMKLISPFKRPLDWLIPFKLKHHMDKRSH